MIVIIRFYDNCKPAIDGFSKNAHLHAADARQHYFSVEQISH
jgi:hypothetical protein